MVRRALQLAVLVSAAACDLDPGIIYRCNLDGGCSREGYACDGQLCVPEDLLDAGRRDAGSADAGPADAGANDAGPRDAGAGDAGELDSGIADAGALDAGTPDAGPPDAGTPALDAGGPDAGFTCGGSCNVQCGYVDAGAGCAPLHCGYCAAGEQCGTEVANTCSPTRLCNADGWCWENPLPQGNSLRAAWSRSSREQFLAGESLTVLRFDGEKLQLLPPPPNLNRALTFYAAGGNATHLYVAGTGGALARWDGTTWTTITGTANVSLRAIAFTSEAIVVGSGYAYRVPLGVSTALPIQLSTSVNLVGVTVTADGAVWALEDDGDLWKLDTSITPPRFSQQPALFPPSVLGRDLASIGMELVTLGAEVLPDAGQAPRVDFIASGAISATQWLPEGLDMNALDVEGDGGVIVVGDDGEVRRVPRTGSVSPNLFALSDVASALRAVAFREPGGGAVVVGTDGHFSVCTPPCASTTDVVRKSGGTTRELFQMCGTTNDELFIVGDRSCGGATCSHRVLGWGPSATSWWQSFDVSSRPATEGRLHRCVDLNGGAQQVVTTTGQVFTRLSNGFTQTPSIDLALAGESIVDLYTDQNDDWYVATSANRVRLFVGGTNASTEASGTVASPLRTIYGVRSRRLTIGDQGATWFVDTNALRLTSASRADNNTQRDFHGRTLPDGGELLVSAGDRGSIWHRVQGTDFSGGGLDGGLTNDFLSVWVTPPGRIVAGTALGQVAFGAPGVPFVTTTTPFVGPLNDTWGVTLPDGGVQVWVVGASGTVLSAPAR